MSQSTSEKSASSAQGFDHHQHIDDHASRAGETTPQESVSSEGIASNLDHLEANLQNMAGPGVQLPRDAATRTQNMLALQQTLGNLSVRRMVQRQSAPSPTPAPAVAPPSTAPPAPDATVPQDLRDFRARGAMPAAAAGTPITISGGGFNARYDPVGMALTITMNLGMNFIDGMRITGERVTATQSSMSGSAVAINAMLSRLSGERRTQALARVREGWQWTGPTDPRITAWMATYRASVIGAWGSAGSGIVFQGSRPGWDTQLARVNLVVNTQNITSVAAGTPIPGPQPVHCRADIYKTPDRDLFGAQVSPGTPAAGTTPRTPGLLELGSGQATPTGQSNILTQNVFFDNNSSTLNAAARDHLRKWVISFQATPGTPGNSISITGRSSTTGNTTEAGRERNADLSLARATAVDHFLRTTSVEGSLLRNAATRISTVLGIGDTGAGEEEEWRRVDIVVGSGQGQNIAAHEFGHMLGLADEYASTPRRDAAGNIIRDAEGNERTRGLVSGTGGDVGTTTGHNQLATDMGLGGSVHENNDNIMSLGSTVRPQHYAPFMSALHTVTGVNDWRVRA
jgi:outer membrane protein OmpA-like peptidoglycan-associated protein